MQGPTNPSGPSNADSSSVIWAHVSSRAVEVPRLDLEVLAVHDPSGDEGGEPYIASRVVGVRKQVGRDICGEHASGQTDAACGGDALAACAGGDVEDGAAGADLGEVEHDVGRLTEPGVDYGAPAVPGGCCCLPLVGGSRLVPSGVERRHDGGCRRRGGRGPCASSAGWSVVMCASIVDTTCSLPSQLPVLGANRPMRHLRESGVQIALDDFGTGYSSLAQLARIPVDILKIDRDFIRNLGESAGRPVMDAIISLSKALGLTTVAEGIEDLGQAAEASNAGIDIGQGYLFSHPLTVDDFALRLPPMSASSPPPVSASPDPITHPITDPDQAARRREDDGPWEAPSARAPQPSARRRSRPTHRNSRLDPPD